MSIEQSESQVNKFWIFFDSIIKDKYLWEKELLEIDKTLYNFSHYPKDSHWKKLWTEFSQWKTVFSSDYVSEKESFLSNNTNRDFYNELCLFIKNNILTEENFSQWITVDKKLIPVILRLYNELYGFKNGIYPYEQLNQQLSELKDGNKYSVSIQYWAYKIVPTFSVWNYLIPIWADNLSNNNKIKANPSYQTDLNDLNAKYIRSKKTLEQESYNQLVMSYIREGEKLIDSSFSTWIYKQYYEDVINKYLLLNKHWEETQQTSFVCYWRICPKKWQELKFAAEMVKILKEKKKDIIWDMDKIIDQEKKQLGELLWVNKDKVDERLQQMSTFFKWIYKDIYNQNGTSSGDNNTFQIVFLDQNNVSWMNNRDCEWWCEVSYPYQARLGEMKIPYNVFLMWDNEIKENFRYSEIYDWISKMLKRFPQYKKAILEMDQKSYKKIIDQYLQKYEDMKNENNAIRKGFEKLHNKKYTFKNVTLISSIEGDQVFFRKEGEEYAPMFFTIPYYEYVDKDDRGWLLPTFEYLWESEKNFYHEENLKYMDENILNQKLKAIAKRY